MQNKTKKELKQEVKLVDFLLKHYQEEEAFSAHEKAVADNLNKMKRLKAERPSVGTSYSDVKVTAAGKSSWIEVKMNVSDQLPSPRFFYDGRKWNTVYKTPVAHQIVEILNTNKDARKFISDVKAFTKKQKPILLSTNSPEKMKDPNYVSLQEMQKFFKGRVDQYVFKMDKIDISKLVETHYTKGKSEPADYFQAGDNLYLIGKSNSFKLPPSIPTIKGKGNLRVRFSMRSSKYEIQAEIKFDTKTIPVSAYSLMPGTKKKNPFEKYR